MTANDKYFFLNLTKAGRTTKSIAKNHNIGNSRISRYKKEGFIEYSSVFNVRTKKMISTIILTRKGKNYMKKYIPEIDYIYSRGSNGIHDLYHSEYFSNLEREQQLAWKTETDLIKHYGEVNENIYSTVDGYVPSVMLADGTITEELVIESVTKSYSKRMIQNKRNYTKEILKSQKGVTFIGEKPNCLSE